MASDMAISSARAARRARKRAGGELAARGEARRSPKRSIGGVVPIAIRLGRPEAARRGRYRATVRRAGNSRTR